MTGYQLAQLNIGVIKGPMDSPVMADFAGNLDRINALAESMSVWQDIKALNDYVYRSAHAELMRRRKEWFERIEEAFTFRHPFPAPDAVRGRTEAPFEDECTAA
jgi:hypothetical protein